MMPEAADDQETVMRDDMPPESEDGAPGHDVVVIFAVFFEAGLAPFSLISGWLLGHPPLENFTWSATDALWGVAAALPLIGLFLAMLRWPVGPLSAVKDLCEREVFPLFHDSSWSELALISLSAGVGEEMLFRGVLQSWLANWLGTAGGLAVASILFGVLHPISFSYILIAGVIGVYLGGIWIYNGNLLTVMLTHALYDFLALGYLIKIVHGRSSQPESE